MFSNIIEIIILSIVQGISEFLPISSSAHLNIVEIIFEFNSNSLMIDVSLHLGSLLAIIFYFRRELLDLRNNQKLLSLLIIGSIPIVIAGYIISSTGLVSILENNLKIIAWTTLIFGIILYLADKSKFDKKISSNLNFKTMENQATSKGIILNNGLYYGLVLIITSLILYALGMHLDPTGGYINLGILAISLIAFPIIGMSAFKKSNNGFMSWGEGVKIGVGIVIIGSLISILYQYAFTTFIEPDFFAQVEEVTRKGLVDAGLTEEQIDTQIEMSSKFQGTLIGNALGLLFMAFLGFVISAIASAVKKESEEETY